MVSSKTVDQQWDRKYQRDAQEKISNDINKMNRINTEKFVGADVNIKDEIKSYKQLKRFQFLGEY